MSFLPQDISERIGQASTARRLTPAPVSGDQQRIRRTGTRVGIRLKMFDANQQTSRGTHMPRSRVDSLPIAAAARVTALQAATMIRRRFTWSGIDGRNGEVNVTVRYGDNLANAYWDGQNVLLGGGDGQFFKPFSGDFTVIAHEMAHGIIPHLEYQGQSGAIAEHLADVIAICAKHAIGPAHANSWIIGPDIWRSGINAQGLRSFRSPGNAFNDPRLGRDRQVAHMDDYLNITGDWGGVHYNSGILNHAFYRAVQLDGRGSRFLAMVWWQAALTLGHTNPTFLEFRQHVLASTSNIALRRKIRVAFRQVGLDS